MGACVFGDGKAIPRVEIRCVGLFTIQHLPSGYHITDKMTPLLRSYIKLRCVKFKNIKTLQIKKSPSKELSYRPSNQKEKYLLLLNDSSNISITGNRPTYSKSLTDFIFSIIDFIYCPKLFVCSCTE
jgi:hypothetical protein